MSPTPKPSDPVAPTRFQNVVEATSHLDAHGIKYVLAQFVDIHGAAKAKAVPVAHLQSVLSEGAGFAGFAI